MPLLKVGATGYILQDKSLNVFFYFEVSEGYISLGQQSTETVAAGISCHLSQL